MTICLQTTVTFDFASDGPVTDQRDPFARPVANVPVRAQQDSDLSQFARQLQTFFGESLSP